MAKWVAMSVDLDHTQFIESQKKALDPPEDMHSFRRNLFIAIFFILFYVLACVAVAVATGGDKVSFVLAGLLFIIAGILAFWFQKCFRGRKKNEKELYLIREVLEGSRGARLITDGADNAVYYNEKFRVLCEGTGETTLDGLSQLFINDAQAYNLFQNLAEKAQKGLTDSLELCSGTGATERWFQVTAQPVSGWAGYVHWRIDDVTNQRDLDRSVRAERAKLIDFTDNAPVGFFSVDEEGRFIFVNATLARWLGNDIQSLLSHEYLHTYLDTPPVNAAPYDIIEGGGVRQLAEVQMKGPGGKTFLASVNQAVVQEDEGRVRTRGVVYDLTSEREMRKALKASEDRFQRFFDEAPVGVVLVDSGGQIEDCNMAFANILGKQPKDIEKHHLKDFLAENDREPIVAAVGGMEQGKRLPAPMEIGLIAGNGKKMVVSMHARRFTNSDNIVLHFIDLTGQKELEVQFVQSQKMQAIGQLAGGIAHDFNNLLTAIIGFCDLLLLRHKPGDPSFGDIMQIKQNSNRAANLVRQLLAFSRQQTLRPRIHDVGEILTELSYLMRRLIGTNIELEVIHGSNLGLVKIDVGQMEQVLINLAVNARDAIEEVSGENSGKLTITTDNFENDQNIKCCEDDMPPGQWVSIAVSDTGCGISPENLARVLEPFFTTKDVGQGTGLGLATVYGIIRQTGGYLHVDSEIGKGTTFTIYLPRLSEEEIKEGQTEDQKDSEEVSGDLTGTATILLVEDEDAVRTFSTRALTNKGYEVLSAENGQAAVNLLEENDTPIDLLITDVMMPDMDGPTLAKHMRENNPKLKIIFISGYTEEKLKDHMGDNIYFLPKPFTLKKLASKVKEALEE
ncbi:MAG: response regulator [Alphaproteobacteria bacterium]|nr:response regulator [Alphaproteobacteria bacterium]